MKGLPSLLHVNTTHPVMKENGFIIICEGRKLLGQNLMDHMEGHKDRARIKFRLVFGPVINTCKYLTTI
jgi:hypothetical protein